MSNNLSLTSPSINDNTNHAYPSTDPQHEKAKALAFVTSMVSNLSSKNPALAKRLQEQLEQQLKFKLPVNPIKDTATISKRDLDQAYAVQQETNAPEDKLD